MAESKGKREFHRIINTAATQAVASVGGEGETGRRHTGQVRHGQKVSGIDQDRLSVLRKKRAICPSEKRRQWFQDVKSVDVATVYFKIVQVMHFPSGMT